MNATNETLMTVTKVNRQIRKCWLISYKPSIEKCHSHLTHFHIRLCCPFASIYRCQLNRSVIYRQLKTKKFHLNGPFAIATCCFDSQNLSPHFALTFKHAYITGCVAVFRYPQKTTHGRAGGQISISLPLPPWKKKSAHFPNHQLRNLIQ